MTIRMLFLPRESFPTIRVDVDVLFGRELLGRGHHIDFVMQAQDGAVAVGERPWNGRTVWVGPTDAADGFVHRLRKHLLSIWHDLRYLLRARRPGYAALQVKDKYVIASIAIVIARLRGLKFFYWLSWPEPESQLLRARQGSARYPKLAAIRGRTYALLLYHWILPRSDHIFVQSERMKRDVCARGARPEKVTPVPMGVDFSAVPPIGKAKRRDVEALPATLTIVGDGNVPEERLALERRAQELGVRGHLEITGFMPRAEAFERVRSADIGLSPFYPTPILLSTSPTKLVEYLALGLPVVANDHPEQRLVLHETRAGVCVPWGAQHFARAVRWLMKRPPQEREAMGARGRAWVEAHRTYARIADNLERTYTELLS
jgi:glycosyltransferase involved in cell wall biosynthesis